MVVSIELNRPHTDFAPRMAVTRSAHSDFFGTQGICQCPQIECRDGHLLSRAGRAIYCRQRAENAQSGWAISPIGDLAGQKIARYLRGVVQDERNKGCYEKYGNRRTASSDAR